MAANPECGEVDITVAGSTYTLKLSMRAARHLQKLKKKSIGELFLEARRADWDVIGLLMFALLQEHHGKEFPTQKEVDDLIDAAGGPRVFYAYCEGMDAIEEAAKAPGVEGAAENPPTAQAGTGDGFRLQLAESA